MINSLSALASAFTILFLFWTITHIARKVLVKFEKDLTVARMTGIIGAGLVGALAYTFSDTFWFSAVEGEVYASSSLFTAVVFWAILKWEDVADQSGSDRWLILIAYLMGLSIGVHLLNLLAIPAIVLVYYFRNYQVSTKGVISAMIISAIVLGVVLYGIIPGFVEVASWFELFFVNTLGMPFNTGLFVYIVLTLASLSWAIYETGLARNTTLMAISYVLAVTLVGIPFFGSHIVLGIFIIAVLAAFFYFNRNSISSRWLNTSIVMITLILIGYSTYAVIVIRSAANPPMDQNSPDNVFALKYYLNREQYGDRPLFYGAVYNAPVELRIEGNMCIPVEEKGEPQYVPQPKTSEGEKDRYKMIGYKTSYKMDSRFKMLFPRMYSPTPSHIEAYKSWADIKGTPITFDYCGQQRTEIKPTFGENLRFFFAYQLNFMYWRYFLWNFSGRQNDIQSVGEIDRGNWITGINFIDKILVGDQTNLPPELAENKGRNKYYMLPLLLGILGILFLINSGREGKHNFWIILLLFVLTGIAIVVYLNQTPYQPRERDYAYAGSFYAFSIWIGLGVLFVIKSVEKFMPKSVAALAITVICLGVPALMASENWDDHDRSDRYVARDFGGNYLASCRPNAIIFSNGDNDTFPLWYNQEVEGNRTDVRVCNLSYLQTDWYIDQMKRGAYLSEPLPISWQPKDYVSGKNEVVWVEDQIKEPLNINTAFDFLLSDDERAKQNGESYLPARNLFLPVDSKQAIKTGTVKAEREGEINQRIDITLNRRLTKSELMVLEMMRTNNWNRPIYFAVTVGDDYYLGLSDHFELTGMAYQIVPTGVKGAGPQVNTNEMYENMMNKFRYGGVDKPGIYLDENTLRMCRTHRMMFSQLVTALYNEGDSVRALKALDYCNKVLPAYNIRHDYVSTVLAEYYYKLGQRKKGDEIMDAVANDCVKNLEWYFSLGSSKYNSVKNRVSHNLAVLNQVLRICEQEKQKTIFDKYMPIYMRYTQSSQL
jgi:MFS family permease